MINRKFLHYPEWQDTADTLHLLLQISGKIKLEKNHPRPEWAHIRHYLTADGLTTGIIPDEKSPFELDFNFREQYLKIHNTEQRQVIIPLKDGQSISWYYKKIMEALEYLGSPVRINTRCQEFYDQVELDKDERYHSFDEISVLIFLDNLYFACNAMRGFIAPFRGKVDNPAYYFGTMDLSAIIYSGEPAPFGKDAAISAHAFDERNLEIGFWPGDVHFPEPAFYILPYPFITDIQGNDEMIRPDKAWFSPEKKEFFLKLEDAFSYDDPTEKVKEFFKSGWDINQKLKRWDNLDWITHPLLYQKQE